MRAASRRSPDPSPIAHRPVDELLRVKQCSAQHLARSGRILLERQMAHPEFGSGGAGVAFGCATAQLANEVPFSVWRPLGAAANQYTH
jgi:hypothetical protein